MIGPVSATKWGQSATKAAKSGTDKKTPGFDWLSAGGLNGDNLAFTGFEFVTLKRLAPDLSELSTILGVISPRTCSPYSSDQPYSFQRVTITFDIVQIFFKKPARGPVYYGLGALIFKSYPGVAVGFTFSTWPALAGFFFLFV